MWTCEAGRAGVLLCGVGAQVERIREMEVAAARLDEASKARRQLEGERLELDRLHGERLAKLRTREEEMLDKLRRQQVRRSLVTNSVTGGADTGGAMGCRVGQAWGCWRL